MLSGPRVTQTSACRNVGNCQHRIWPGESAQPSTTVFNRVRLRNRAREVAVTLRIAMAIKVVTCGRFKCCTRSFRLADVAFRATSISVGTCQKPSGVTGEILKR